MMMKRLILTAAAALPLLSCSVDDTGSLQDGRLLVKTDGAGDGGKITAVVFGSDGRLKEWGEYSQGSDGTYGVRTSVTTGTIYVTGGGAVPDNIEEGMTQQQWTESVLSLSDGQSAGLFFTGEASLDDVRSGPLSIRARYGVAKLGMRVTANGNASVSAVTVHNAAMDGYIFPSETVRTPQGARRSDIGISFPEPLRGESAQIALLLEQQSPDLSVTVEAVIDGKSVTLEHALPSEIERNNIYYVNIITGEEPSIEVTVEEWSDGGDTGLYPDFGSTLAIDGQESVLPGNSQLTDGGKTLILSHLQAEMTVKIQCNSTLELQPFSNSLVSITPADEKNTYRISKVLTAPGVKAERALMRFRRHGLDNVYDEDTIALVLKANPVVTGGSLDFSRGDYAHRFGRYIDNQLDVFTLPEGKKIAAEFAADEDHWVKFIESEDTPGTFRLVAGWKPNDPKADGREQEAVIVINNTDGSDREEYTISRLNYGLPVTWLNGTWWCKYNARGDSRSFEDQILCNEDPAALAGKTVFDYLRDCSAEEYYDLWGWLYQGSSGRGMRIVEQDGKAVAEGFDSGASVHMNKLDPKALSPDGYEMPSMEDYNMIFDATDYVWLMWDGSHTLKTPWEGHRTIQRKQRRRNDVMVGDLNVKDLIYISMYNTDFPEREAVVWYGPAAQWDANGIIHGGHYNNILFTVYSPAGSGWYFSGGMSNLYLTKNGAGTKDCRIIRFKKSPVEYIY